MWQLKKDTAICNQCIKTNGLKIKDPCSYLREVATQQEITVIELQDDWELQQTIVEKQKQLIWNHKKKVKAFKAEIKAIQLQKDTEMRGAEETLALVESKLSEIQTAEASPVLYMGVGLLLIAAIIFMVVLWRKINYTVSDKIGSIIDSRLTKWLAQHVIGETGSYTDGNFTLHIKHKDEVIHGGERKPPDK